MKKNMKKLIVLILSCLMVFSALSLTGCGAKTINLNSYLSYLAEGYEHHGSMTTNFEASRLEEDALKAIGYSESKLDKLNDSDFVKIMALEACLFDINGEWDKQDELSNGDVVTYKWNISESTKKTLKDEFKLNIKCEDVTYTVSGLYDIQEGDVFEDINIEVSGTAPNGKIAVESEKYSQLYFDVSKESGLSNGDVVTISLDKNYDLTCLDYYGFIPSRYEMEYTVDGLDEYIATLDKVPEDIETQIKSQLDDFVEASYAKSYTKSLVSYEVLGYYFLTPKGAVSSYNPIYNQFYIVYKTDIHYNNNKDGDRNVQEDITAYKYLKFTNLTKYADGTGYVDILNYSNPVYGGFGDNEFYFTSTNSVNYAGFKDLDTFVNQCITAQKADWNVETNME